MADPRNARRCRSAQFERLHFARLVAARRPDAAGRPAKPTVCRAAHACRRTSRFIGDCDGPADDVLADLAQRAGAGLRGSSRTAQASTPTAICSPGCWRTIARAAASYVNWVGRSVRDRSARKARCSVPWPRESARRSLASGDRRAAAPARARWPSSQPKSGAGRLALTPGRADAARLADSPSSRNAVAVPLLGSSLLPLLIVLRCRSARLSAANARDQRPRNLPAPARPTVCEALQELEDHDVTNQYTALGAVKPGLFRRWLLDGAAGADRLRLPARLHARPPGAGADDPLCALGLPRRQEPGRRSSSNYDGSHRELHGRLHQQGRLGPEPRCSATASAGRARAG